MKWYVVDDEGTVYRFSEAETERRAWQLFDDTMRARAALVDPLRALHAEQRPALT